MERLDRIAGPGGDGVRQRLPGRVAGAGAQRGGRDHQGRAVDGADQQVEPPGVGSVRVRTVVDRRAGDVRVGVVAERLGEAEVEPQRPVRRARRLPGREPFGQSGGRLLAEPSVGRVQGGEEGLRGRIELGQRDPGLLVDQGVEHPGEQRGGGRRRGPVGRAGPAGPAVGGGRRRVLGPAHRRAARDQRGRLPAGRRVRRGPPAGVPLPRLLDRHRQQPPPPDQPPGQIVHGGQPAHRGAVRQLGRRAVRQLHGGARPVRIVQRAEQLGGLGAVEEQRGHPPRTQPHPARAGPDRQVRRRRGPPAEARQQQPRPPLDSLLGQPPQPRPDRPQQPRHLPGRTGERVRRATPVGPVPGLVRITPVHRRVLRPDGEPAVGSPERVQGVHRRAAPLDGTGLPP